MSPRPALNPSVLASAIQSQVQITSGYNVSIFLIPYRVANSAAGDEPIKLTISGNKTLPGLAEGENWQFSTDDPGQEIAETIVGKFGGISPLSFEVPYDPMLLKILVVHAKTNFTVLVVYDDTNYECAYYIEVFDCFLTTPGSTSGMSNNSAGNMTVTLQPRGGGRLADSMRTTEVLRD